MKKLLLISVLMALPNLAAAGGYSKVTLGAAQEVCSVRALRYSESIIGRDANLPSSMQVRDRYRSCVHAKSGFYPNQKLSLHKNILFDLQKVLGL